MCVLLVALAWISLPWWLPTNVIRRKLAASLAQQMGVEVNVSALALSWAGGVELNGLSIAGPGGFGHGDLGPASQPMIYIDKIRCDFSPLALLLNRRLEWMEIVRPRLRVRIDAKGNINLALLKKLQTGPEVGRISVRDAEVSLQLPDQPDLPTMRVGNLELQQGLVSQLGRVTMTASLGQQKTAAPMSLQISSGQPSQTSALDAAFHFANLDLSQIPLPSGQRFPLRSLAGRCEGRLKLKISDNLQVEQLDMELSVNKLKVTPTGGRTLPTIDLAGLKLSAAVDSASEQINISSLHVRLPGVNLAGQASIYADIITDGFDAVERFDLRGQVQPAQLLAMLRGRETLPGGLAMVGQVTTKIAGRRDGENFSLSSALQADGLTIRSGTRTLKPAGRKMKLGLAVSIQPRYRALAIELQQGRLSLGKNIFTATGQVILPQDRPDNTSKTGLAMAQQMLQAIGDIRARGTVELNELGDMKPLLPPGARAKIHLVGGLSGTWQIGGSRFTRLTASLRAGTETELGFGDLLVKPAGREMAVDFSAVAEAEAMTLGDISIDFSVGKSWASIEKGYVRLPSRGATMKIAGDFQAVAIEGILASLPRFKTTGASVSGGLAGDFSAKLTQRTEIACSVDMHELALGLGDAFAKSAGKPMSLTVKVDGPEPGQSGPWTLTARAKTHQARLDTQLTLPQANDASTATAVFGGDIDDMGWLAEASPALSKALGTGLVKGKLNIAGRAKLSPNKADFLLACKSENLAYLARTQAQPVVNGPFTLNITGTLASSPSEPNLATLHLRDVQSQLGQIHLLADALVELRRDQARPGVTLLPSKAHVSVWTNQAQSLGRLLPAWSRYAPAGDFFADLMWQGSSEAGTITAATFYARGLQGQYLGKDVFLRGTVQLENIQLANDKIIAVGRMTTDDLEFRAGKNHGWLLADICSPLARPSGKFHALLEYLDVKEMTDWLARPGKQTPPGPFDQARQDWLQARAREVIASLKSSLGQADISGKISAEQLNVFDEKVSQKYHTEQFELDMSLRRGKGDLTYLAGVCGGGTRGHLETNILDESPTLTSRIEFSDVIATAEIQPQIMLYFPGNVVSGTFSRDEHVTYPLRDMIADAIDPRYRIKQVGKAKMVATDGVVIGRAAPKFMVNVFPRLNLTRYPYRHMTGYSDFLPDGSARNEMFFFGSYDLYMQGVTDPTNAVNYTVGLILFGSAVSPEALRDWKQGRIPMIKVRGKIRDGKLIDDVVSYPLPNETLFDVFLKNSMVYRAWVNLRKKPDARPPDLP